MHYAVLDSRDANDFFSLEYFLLTQTEINDNVFMLWRTNPCLMLGANQNLAGEINLDYAEKHNIQVTRRLSGGGTIFTDLQTLQYTIFFPGTEELSGKLRQVTKQAVQALNELGIPAEFNGRNDIIVEGRKVSGSAGYSKNQRYIHHGSLLFDTDLEMLSNALNVSPEKLAAKGVKSVRSRVALLKDYFKGSVENFAAEFPKIFLGNRAEKLNITREMLSQISIIKREIFANPVRIKGFDRFLPQNINKRFPACGSIEVNLASDNNCITEIKFSGDFFFDGELHAFEDSLSGTTIEKAAIEDKCRQSNHGFFAGLTYAELADLITQCR